MSSQLVDLHCHILPGIDDGAKNLDVSMSLIQKEMEDGVVGIVFTPHFHYERITLDAFVQQRKMAYRSVVAQLADETEKTHISGLAGPWANGSGTAAGPCLSAALPAVRHGT